MKITENLASMVYAGYEVMAKDKLEQIASINRSLQAVQQAENGEDPEFTISSLEWFLQAAGSAEDLHARIHEMTNEIKALSVEMDLFALSANRVGVRCRNSMCFDGIKDGNAKYYVAHAPGYRTALHRAKSKDELISMMRVIGATNDHAFSN